MAAQYSLVDIRDSKCGAGRAIPAGRWFRWIDDLCPIACRIPHAARGSPRLPRYISRVGQDSTNGHKAGYSCE